MPGPMMGDTPSGVVARRMWPSSVASLGRVTHAPADSTLYRAIMRGQLLHPSGAAPGFDGVGSIRHRSQNFLRRVAELFRWGWERGAAGESFGCGRPCDHQRQVPAVHCVRGRGGAPDPVHRQSGGLFRCAPATCIHSANCAEDRRDPTAAVLGQG